MKMKKKILIFAMIAAVAIVSAAGCGRKSSKTANEPSAAAESEEEEDLLDSSDEVITQDLSTYEKVMDVLCGSKVNADVEQFLDLFNYMRKLMRSVVTEEDYFNKIAEGYKDECGENITWTYEITRLDAVTGEALEVYQETVRTFGSKAQIDEAYDMVAAVHLKGDKGTKDYNLEIAVGKIDESWQIVNFGDTLLQ